MDGVEIRPSPIAGNGLFATADSQPGDIVFEIERPLVATLDRDRIDNTCGWCFNWVDLPLDAAPASPQTSRPKVNWCTGCRKIKYCSKACQTSSWRASHKFECKKLERHAYTLPNTVWALDQIQEGLNRQDRAYEGVTKLESHYDEIKRTGGERWEGAQMMARATAMFNRKPLDPAQMGPLVNLMCILCSNSLTLITPTFDPLGLMLDPRVCSANHSCDPNVIIVMDGPKLQLRALKPVPSGEEVLISYTESEQPFGVRQAELKERWHFTCRCPKCLLGTSAPQDQFLSGGATSKPEGSGEFEEMWQKAMQDPTFERHKLGASLRERMLSIVQAQTFSLLQSAESGEPDEAVEPCTRAIAVCLSTGAWPLTRAPIPALYRTLFIANLSRGAFIEAFLVRLKTYFLIDPALYPEPFHPTRLIHTWSLATTARALDSTPDLSDHPVRSHMLEQNVQFGILFVGLLMEMHEQIPKSFGRDSMVGRMVERSWRELMEPEGELMTGQAHLGLSRAEWHERMRGSWGRERGKFERIAREEVPMGG